MILVTLLNMVSELRGTPSWQDGGSFIWADGYDFPGQDLNANSPAKTSKEGCGPSCYANPQCVRFSWDTSGNCYHKKWSTVGTKDKRGARTGYILGRPWTTSGNIVWGDNCDFPGQDTNANNPAKTSKEGCGTSCLNNRVNCDYFSWDTSGNCYHKLWKGSFATKKDGARCGYITSPPPTSAPPWAPSWKDNGNLRWASDCHYTGGSGGGGSTQWDTLISTCGDQCRRNVVTFNSEPCLYFFLEGNFCYMRSKNDAPAGPFYKSGTQCGYIKDRV